MTHEEMRGIFADVYNKFYLAYRNDESGKVRTEEEWETLINAGNEIVNKHNNNKFASTLINMIIEEFEIRERENN